MGYSIRTQRYRYVEWRRNDTGKVVARELYDHHNDSGEAVNIAASSPEIIGDLAKILQAGWEKSRPEVQ